MANLNITIPDKVYVGFSRSGENMPVGVMTPFSEDSAGLKRQATVERQTRGYQNNQGYNCVTLENKPMPGFRISRALRRGGWRSNTTVIRIEDPRGFELEINAVNMIMITDNNTIQNGEILCDCVWGRDAGENVLLPVNSEPYLEAAENTRRLSTKTSLRDVKPGDMVLAMNGQRGVYLGSLFPIRTERGYRQSTRSVSLDAKKRYVLKTVDDDGVASYDGYTALKVSEVLEQAETPLTPSQVREEISNARLQTGAQINDHASRSWNNRVLGFTANPIKLRSVELNTTDEATVIASVVASETACTIFGRSNGKVYMFTADNFVHGGRNRSQRYVHGHGYTASNDFAAFQVDPNHLSNAIIDPRNNMALVPEVDLEEMFTATAVYEDTKTGETFKVLL